MDMFPPVSIHDWSTDSFFVYLRLRIQDDNEPPFGEITILSIEETENATDTVSQTFTDVTNLPFKVPPPPKPEVLERRKF